jgi:ABC-type transporter Mla subunit MlaD
LTRPRIGATNDALGARLRSANETLEAIEAKTAELDRLMERGAPMETLAKLNKELDALVAEASSAVPEDMQEFGATAQLAAQLEVHAEEKLPVDAGAAAAAAAGGGGHGPGPGPARGPGDDAPNGGARNGGVGI